MNIDSTNPIINSTSSVINELRSGHTLPFQDVLSAETLGSTFQKLPIEKERSLQSHNLRQSRRLERTAQSGYLSG